MTTQDDQSHQPDAGPLNEPPDSTGE